MFSSSFVLFHEHSNNFVLWKWSFFMTSTPNSSNISHLWKIHWKASLEACDKNVTTKADKVSVKEFSLLPENTFTYKTQANQVFNFNDIFKEYCHSKIIWTSTSFKKITTLLIYLREKQTYQLVTERSTLRQRDTNLLTTAMN